MYAVLFLFVFLYHHYVQTRINSTREKKAIFNKRNVDTVNKKNRLLIATLKRDKNLSKLSGVNNCCADCT